jgi:hypothetical protein
VRADDSRLSDSRAPTTHDHDTRYVRFDAAHNPVLSAAQRLQARTNIGVFLELLESASAMSAVGAIDLALPSGYRRFTLVVRDMEISGASGGVPGLRVSLNNGSSYPSNTGGYAWSSGYHAAGQGHTVVSQFGSEDSSQISSTGINLSAWGFNSNGNNFGFVTTLEIDPGSASRMGQVEFRTSLIRQPDAYAANTFGSGYYGATGRWTNVRLFLSAGQNMVGQSYELYGWKI